MVIIVMIRMIMFENRISDVTRDTECKIVFPFVIALELLNIISKWITYWIQSDS